MALVCAALVAWVHGRPGEMSNILDLCSNFYWECLLHVSTTRVNAPLLQC
jgi:hypothetical protein